MTKRERTAAVKSIRSRVHRDDVLDPRPVVAKWKDTPPFVPPANLHADRGHVEREPGQCKRCREVRPPGGYPSACKRGDARVFQGG